MSNEITVPKSPHTDKMEISEKKNKFTVNVEDAKWKISSIDRSARLAVMQRTSFPDKINVEPVSGQKIIQLILIMGILTVLFFFFVSHEWNVWHRNAQIRRAAYFLVYKERHSSKMTSADKAEENMNNFDDGCPEMYITNWTKWRLALQPSDVCSTCHKVVKIRSRVIIAQEPDERGKLCPPTIEWSELNHTKWGDMIFDSATINIVE